MAEHEAEQFVFLLVIGMAFRQDHLKIHWNTVIIPGNHEHYEFDSEEPGMVLAHTPLLGGGIFGTPFVFFAAVGNHLEHLVSGRRQTFDGFLGKPVQEQLEAPIAGG